VGVPADRASGIDEEFSLFVAERWTSLVRAGRLIGCSASEAEDLAQTALVKCYVSWSRVQAADDRDAYVYRVLVNAHRSAMRRMSSRETPADVSRARRDEATADSAELSTSVERALARLAPQAREVVVLRYYVDLSERQTADALGIPAGTVKSRLARALAQLSEDPSLADLPGWSTR
jgi:RNA polymerase sigma-70 factor (sigma-E family)